MSQYVTERSNLIGSRLMAARRAIEDMRSQLVDRKVSEEEMRDFLMSGIAAAMDHLQASRDAVLTLDGYADALNQSDK